MPLNLLETAKATASRAVHTLGAPLRFISRVIKCNGGSRKMANGRKKKGGAKKIRLEDLKVMHNFTTPLDVSGEAGIVKSVSMDETAVVVSSIHTSNITLATDSTVETTLQTGVKIAVNQSHKPRPPVPPRTELRKPVETATKKTPPMPPPPRHRHLALTPSSWSKTPAGQAKIEHVRKFLMKEDAQPLVQRSQSCLWWIP